MNMLIRICYKLILEINIDKRDYRFLRYVSTL